jgi:hypothetical protein
MSFRRTNENPQPTAGYTPMMPAEYWSAIEPFIIGGRRRHCAEGDVLREAALRRYCAPCARGLADGVSSAGDR